MSDKVTSAALDRFLVILSWLSVTVVVYVIWQSYQGLERADRKRKYQKDVFKNFAMFTGKHLCWSLFLVKLQGFRSEAPTQVFSCE